MTILSQKSVPAPLQIFDITFAAWKIQVLKSAIELEFFNYLQTPLTAIDLAKKISCSPKGVELLLNALVALELLEKSGNNFKLNDVSGTYLVSNNPTYMGKWLEQAMSPQNETWDKLTEITRNGKPAREVNKDSTAEEFFPKLAEAIFPLSLSAAYIVAEELQQKYAHGPVRILDVACGSGVWSIPFAQMNPELKVDALDFPAILEVTKNFTSKYRVANQYKHIAGNWKDVVWQQSAYDVIILGHILHSEGANLSKQLIQQCARSIKKGGTLIVGDFICNENHTAPPFAALFAINMFLQTTEGCVFSEEHLKSLLTDAGFQNLHQLSYKNGPRSTAWLCVKE